MQLRLDRLAVPSSLSDGTLRCRRCTIDEHDLLTRWRIVHEEEVYGRTATEVTLREARSLVERLCTRGELFVLEVAGDRAAMCTFNARLPDTVQIGGVHTLRSMRGRGYGRSVVAGALLAARAEGAAAAILFTGKDNQAALRAYRALGFERVGDYGLVLFDA